jgi:hypothetical protein
MCGFVNVSAYVAAIAFVRVLQRRWSRGRPRLPKRVAASSTAAIARSGLPRGEELDAACFNAPSELLRADKHTFGAERCARWLGRTNG